MRHKTQLVLFFLAVGCLALGAGVHDSVFNNYLSDTFQMPASARGWLEFPREAPGLLVALMMGALFLLPETAVGTIGAFIFCFGMVGLAQLGTDYSAMMVCMVLGSAGMHLLMPIGSSLAIALAPEGRRGRRLGQMAAVATAGKLLGCAFVWLALEGELRPYRTAFMAVAVAAAAGALFYGRMRMPQLNHPKPRMVFRRKFSLYYVLEFIFGARKQIFITFGPWVLVRVYGLPAAEIAKLLFIGSVLGLAWKPLAGIVIDRFGERVVMVAGGILLCAVCVGYGYAMFFTSSAAAALLVASICYVIDDMLFALGTARAVYASRLAASPQELTSTLAMGVSVNHIASMVIPIFAGALWMAVGYERVFLAAAFLALGVSAVASRVPRQAVPELSEALPVASDEAAA